MPWGFEQIMRGGIVFSRLDDLPAEAAIDKATMQRFEPRSTATMPLTVGDPIIAALGFGVMRTQRSWPPVVLDRLRSAAHIAAGRHGHEPRRLSLCREILIPEGE